MRPLSSSEKSSLSLATLKYERDLETACEYLTARGIDHATSEEFRLGVVSDPITGHERFAGRLAIPSIGPKGNIYNLRFRSLDSSEPKYLGIPGMTSRLFNLRAITQAQDVIAITEGEIDAISLEVAGFKAVGCPGANSWKRHHPRMFVGFQKVLVFGDGDKAGQEFAVAVCESLRNSTNVRLSEGDDVNAVLVRDGIEGIHSLAEEAMKRGR